MSTPISENTSSPKENKDQEYEERKRAVHGWYYEAGNAFDVDRYFKVRVLGQLEYFNGKAAKEKDLFFKLQWLLIITSALTPVLISIGPELKGVGFYADTIVYWLTIGISLVVAVASSVLKTFKHQENWLMARTICEMIHREKFLHEAGLSPYHNLKNRDRLLVKNIEDMLGNHQNLWASMSREAQVDKKEEDQELLLVRTDVAKKGDVKAVEIGSEEIAYRMFTNGMREEEILSLTGISKEQFQKIRESKA